MKRLSWILICFLTLSSACAKEPLAPVYAEKIAIDHEYFLSAYRNQGQSIGSSCSYTSLESLSFPFHYRSLWPFLDVRAHCFDQGSKFAANIGIGLRIDPQWRDQIFGINLYYDCKNVHHGNFNQIGLGLEALGKCFNFRFNGYLPLGTRKIRTSHCLFNQYEGDYFVLHENFIDSLMGCDFEVEAHLTKIWCNDIWLGLKSYYYSSECDCCEDIYGVEYRISTYFFDYFNFTISASHDNTFKTRVQAQFGFTISLDRLSLDRRLFQPVQRNELIVHEDSGKWTWNF